MCLKTTSIRERERERRGEKNEMEKKVGSRRQSKEEGDNGKYKDIYGGGGLSLIHI